MPAGPWGSMNPNSAHQVWSRWTFTVCPGRSKVRSMADMRTNCARFARKAFGSAGAIHLEHRTDAWVVSVRAEGHPVHDPSYVAYLLSAWTRFFVTGFGPGTTVHLDTAFEAGDRQDGRPTDQLVILPPIAVPADAGAVS